MFVVNGKRGSWPITVTWDAGVLSGDADFCRLVQITSAEMDTAGPPGGPYTEENHLASPLSAFFIIAQLMEIESAEGDVPQAPDVPDDAIA